MNAYIDRICDAIDGTTDEGLSTIFAHVCKRVVESSKGPRQFVEFLKADDSGTFEELCGWFKEED